MVKIFPWLVVVPISFLCSACVSYDEKTDVNEPGSLDLILCETPRPQICTREYDPVCATLSDGSVKTGSTACTACSDTEAVGYRAGEC